MQIVSAKNEGNFFCFFYNHLRMAQLSQHPDVLLCTGSSSAVGENAGAVHFLQQFTFHLLLPTPTAHCEYQRERKMK